METPAIKFSQKILTNGNDFLADLCYQWEKAAEEVESLNVRRVSIRSGIALSKEEGILKKLLLPFKFYAGSTYREWKSMVPVDTH